MTSQEPEQIPGTVKQASEEGDTPDTEENTGTVKQASEEGDKPDVDENVGDVPQASEEGATVVPPDDAPVAGSGGK